MISKIWNKPGTREAVTYIIFGVLTTLVDWVTHTSLWNMGTDYRISTAVSWAAAVLFAFVTNKLFVFRSFDLHPKYLWKEFSSFVACRAATGIFTFAAMIVMVDVLHWHELIGKAVVSAISLVLNYILSKLIIFKNKNDGEEQVNGT